ncbi:glutathione S-transferase [Novosphingobium sp. PC22D]|uniref:glutathione S-transferase N-terminal domain-containing protein n=1 Tax=Novosphingobium sp. PC22D TaxID=1962403 RepID=UPI000BF00D60|nr:glutathione S-transferase N-terminal domain-containing protein [Novosphingobium sp. PC22D]PEQ13145.1 glutathione S-transferase [Novosphingobium sp. PC22D]
MKLYYAPGACSLSDHISLHEAGLPFEHERVDLSTGKTEHGNDFFAVNPKGYVPALELDDGSLLTENVAILDWIGQQAPKLVPEGPLGRTRMLEALAFTGSELHKNFAPFFAEGSEEEKAKASKMLDKRFGEIADTIDGPFLFGERFTVADAYLFVISTWTEHFDLDLPASLRAFQDRVKQRPAVRKAMEHEGLLEEA